MTNDQLGSLVGSIKAAAPALGLGGAGASFPIWGQMIELATGLNTFVVSVLGLVVLVLTVRKLWIDSQIALHNLDRLDRDHRPPPADNED